MVSVDDKLNNIELVVEDIKKEPQKYNTILKDKFFNGTCQFKLRRKINKLCKQGIIYKCAIPGTRFGQVLLYYIPKDYHVVVENDRVGVNIYYFFKYKKLGTYRIKIDEYWLLDNNKWEYIEDELTLFEGKILKFI